MAQVESAFKALEQIDRDGVIPSMIPPLNQSRSPIPSGCSSSQPTYTGVVGHVLVHCHGETEGSIRIQAVSW